MDGQLWRNITMNFDDKITNPINFVDGKKKRN